MILTPDQLHILQHSLGCDIYGRTTYRGQDEGDGCGAYYRNRYVSDPTPDLEILVAAGLLEDGGEKQVYGDMHCYRVTPAGNAAMKAQSLKSPKLTEGQQRYREWQRADCGVSFGEWLLFKRA